MSERVQLLLSDRILGMTLVPEGRIWNYGIGLTQLWSANMNYAVQLDTPLLFWAEEHRPAAFISVSRNHACFVALVSNSVSSLPTSRQEMTAPTSKTTSRRQTPTASNLAHHSSYSQIALLYCIVMYCTNKLLYFRGYEDDDSDRSVRECYARLKILDYTLLNTYYGDQSRRAHG